MRRPLTSEELLDRLAAMGIAARTWHHPPIMTVEDGLAHWRDVPGVHCKNLFLKDAKGAYWLVVTPIERTIDLKSLPERIGSKRLSFAGAERLREVLGVEPGSVTPFALINDIERRVRVVLDRWMMAQAHIAYHPLVNTATTVITPAELRRFIDACGHVADEVPLDAA